MDFSVSPRLSSLPAVAATGTKESTVGLLHFALCGSGGALAGVLTHRFQHPTFPQVPVETAAKQPRANPRFRKTVGSVGGGALGNGWSPLSVRRASVQGAALFALYDGFKNLYGGWFSDEEGAYKYRMFIPVFSAVSAQYLTNQLLFPFENIQYLRMPSFSEVLLGIKQGLLRDQRVRNTMVQFVLFEEMLEMFYKHKAKHDCSVPEQLVKTVAAGYIAGFMRACTLWCHSFWNTIFYTDAAASEKIFNQFKKSSTLLAVGRSCSAVGVASGLQWLIYEGFKIATGISRQVPPTRP